LDRTTGPVQKGRKIVGRKISAPVHEKSNLPARHFPAKTNRLSLVELDGELMAEIDSHWQPYAEAFGYQ